MKCLHHSKRNWFQLTIPPIWGKGPKASSSNSFPAICLHKPAHWRSSAPTFLPSSRLLPPFPFSTPPPTSRYPQSCPTDPPLLPPNSSPFWSCSCLSLFNSSHHHQYYHRGLRKTIRHIETYRSDRRRCVRTSASSRSRYLSLDHSKCLSSRKQSGWRRSSITRLRI